MPRSRPTRTAAAAATERLNNRHEEEDAWSDSFESEGEDEESSSSEEMPPQPLSEYERQRADNIRANQQVLADLGLAGGTARNVAAAGRRRAARDLEKEEDGDEDFEEAPPAAARAPAAARTASKGRKKRQRSSSEPAAAAAVATSGGSGSGNGNTAEEPKPADTEAYFRLLIGEGGGSLISAAMIQRMARDLGLDTSASGFSEEKIALMLDSFDQSGKGGVSIDDFRRIMRQVARA